MERPNLEIAPKTKAEAIAAIAFIMQECSAMGANDSELPDLTRLIESVRNDEIDPDEAIRQAESIKASKMDYH